MMTTSTNPTVRALADSPEHPLARAGLRMGRQKFGRTFLDGDDPERTPATPDGDRPLLDHGGRRAAVSGTPINFRIAPNAGLLQGES
jgi:hypothetical protein